MTQFYKFFVGQKVRIIRRCAKSKEKDWGYLCGTVQTVYAKRFNFEDHMPEYTLVGIPLSFLETSLAPVGDNKPTLSTWDEITKLIGKDIRNLET